LFLCVRTRSEKTEHTSVQHAGRDIHEPN
jgi:hypothetical protein